MITESISVAEYSRPHCSLYLASTPKGICQITFAARQSYDSFKNALPGPVDSQHTEHLNHLKHELDAYFKTVLISFQTPIVFLSGTDFEKTVWIALQHIPYGTVKSYAQIAKQINRPKAVRAVGNANAANPLPIVIPCHRVIASDGKIGGYGAGVETKRKLLRLEGIEC